MKKELMREIRKHGEDILKSTNMLAERGWMQHGKVSVYQHSVRVAFFSLLLVKILRLSVNRRALVRGALLHDYFLYDWHEKDDSHKWHGFHHARKAKENAERDFELDEVEKDIIEKHMFPLNKGIPKFKESRIVCVADKITATGETIFRK